MKNKKIIFTINVDNQIDLITNSSSELFVLQGKTKEIIEEMLIDVYPDYKSEYDNIKNITELSAGELDQYMNYLCSAPVWPATKAMMPVPNGFTFDELYETDEEPAWNGHYQYELKNNQHNPAHKWDTSFVTEENKEEIINKLSPNKDMWFLFSLDENPNYDYQEKLETIGTRFHLG